ncbi:hypothetical protein ACFL5V_10205 [Fibrobacterota bacterium]
MITDRFIDKVPVSALTFEQRRKYITPDESVSILVQGYHKGFECSQISNFSIEAQGDTLRPDISFIYPERIDDCPVSGDEGMDSLLTVSFEDWDTATLPRWIYLANSGDSVTDWASLVNATKGLLDTILVDSTRAVWTDSSVNYLPEFWPIYCKDSVSYVFYCISADSLYFRMETARREEDSCDHRNLYYKTETEYFHKVRPDSVRGCAVIFE